jgi:hypothetical protein
MGFDLLGSSGAPRVNYRPRWSYQLKGVLGVEVYQSPSADAPGHRRVPPHQGLQRQAVPTSEVRFQQLAVGLLGAFLQQRGSA